MITMIKSEVKIDVRSNLAKGRISAPSKVPRLSGMGEHGPHLVHGFSIPRESAPPP